MSRPRVRQSLRLPRVISRDWALLWSGQAISNIGDWIFDTTLVLWIANRLARNEPWAPLAVSGVFLATSTATLAVGPIAGVFVDRWDKRRTMLAADALRAALILALLFVSATAAIPGLPAPLPGGAAPREWTLGAIYVTVTLATACARFFDPARLTLSGDLVPEVHRASTSGLAQTTANLAMIVGPIIAAWLFFGAGLEWALAANALSFIVSFLTLLAIRPPRTPSEAEGVPETGTSPHQRLGAEFGAGARFFGGNAVLRSMTVAMVLVLLGGGASNTLGYFFVTQNLRAAPAVYGYIGAARGAGLLLGAALAGGLARRLGVGRMFWLGIVGVGLLEVAYARLTSVGPALLLLVAQGTLNASLNVAVGPLVLHVTPRRLVGRVFALFIPALNLAGMLSALAAGYLASVVLKDLHATIVGIPVGPVDTIFTASGLLACLGGLYAHRKLDGVRLGGDPIVATAVEGGHA